MQTEQPTTEQQLEAFVEAGQAAQVAVDEALKQTNGDPAPTLALEGVIRARCTKCGTPIATSVVDKPLGSCPECGGELVVVAATGATAEQAIAAAAAAMPEKVDSRESAGDSQQSPAGELKQPTLPGLRRPFDVAAALELIEQQEKVASDAAAAYEQRKIAASYARKRADEEADKLRTLIQDLRRRREEYAPEPVEAAAQLDTSAEPASEEMLAAPSAEEDAQYLRLELEKAGAPHVTVEAILAWTAPQRDEAWAWAKAQIHANATADEGHTVSVRWPKHVSQANSRAAEPEPARKPRPRHANPKARQAAKQQATREEREASAASHDKPRKGGTRAKERRR